MNNLLDLAANEKKLIVIIVTYNGELWIERCLKSIQDSTVHSTVMVIDNASKDKTTSIIKHFPRTILIENSSNIGFGQANNIGLEYALTQQFEHIFLLNQDTVIYPDMLEILVRIQEQSPEFGLLSPLHLTGKGDKLDAKFYDYVVKSCKNYIQESLLYLPVKQVYRINFVNAAFWLISRNCLLKTGGFDSVFFHRGEDVDYSNRVKYHGFFIGICPNAKGFHYRENRPNENSFENVLKKKYIIALEQLKNPFYKFHSTFYSTVIQLFRNSIMQFFQLHFTVCRFNWKLMILIIKSFTKIKRSREKELSNKSPHLFENDKKH
jgi:GT2 family glycosyltransferase